MASSSPLRRALPWLLLAVLVTVAGGVFLRKGTRGASELPVYTLGAVRMWDGEEIYRPTDLKPFTYPPFFALPFVPMLPLPAVPIEAPRPWLPILAWYLVNTAVLFWLVSSLHRALVCRAPMGQAPPLGWFWLVTMALSFRHVSAAFENQSHDLLVFAAVLAGALRWSRGQGLAAGAWIGAAAACKATPLLFLGPLFLRGRWLALLGLGVAAVALTLLPDVVLPRSDGQLWVVAWVDTFLTGLRPDQTAAADGAWSAGSELNQSLSGTLHRLTTPTERNPGRFVRNVALVEASPGLRAGVILGGRLLVLALVAWAALLPWWRCRRGGGGRPSRRGDALLIAGATACGMVLLSPMSSKSHFCVLLLPIAACVAALWGRRRRDPVLVVLLALVFVLGTGTAKGFLGKEIGGEVLAYGAVTWTALATLLATLRVLSASPEPGRDDL